jgi:hypothetical protein
LCSLFNPDFYLADRTFIQGRTGKLGHRGKSGHPPDHTYQNRSIISHGSSIGIYIGVTIEINPTAGTANIMTTYAVVLQYRIHTGKKYGSGCITLVIDLWEEVFLAVIIAGRQKNYDQQGGTKHYRNFHYIMDSVK